MAEKLGAFNVGKFLQDNNMKLRAPIANGVYEVEDDKGQIGQLDVFTMLHDQGVKPGLVDFEVNDPSTALDTSPVNPLERLKLKGLGNEKGQIAYLKNQFDDVKLDKEKGLVVKNQGVWQTLDPEYLGQGDAWQRTGELLSDIGDLADVGIASATSPLAALGGPAVSGAASAGSRIFLGKMAGTYAGTPEEIAQDIAFETLLTYGGAKAAPAIKAGVQKLGSMPGVKPTVEMLGNGLKGIAEYATERSKDAIATVLGTLSNATPKAMRQAMSGIGDDVTSKIKFLAKKGGTLSDVDAHVGKTIDSLGSQLADAIDDGVTKLYGEKRGELIKAAATKMGEVNVGGMVTGTLDDLVNMGFLKKNVAKNGKLIGYELIDDLTAVARKNQGLAVQEIDGSIRPALQSLVDKLNAKTGLGTFKGGRAASELMDFMKGVNAIVRQASVGSPGAEQMLNQFKATVNLNAQKLFAAHGLEDVYKATGGVYTRFQDVLDRVRTLAPKLTGGTKFAQEVLNDVSSKLDKSGFAKDAVELLGKDGEKLVGEIVNWNVAKQMSPWLSRTGVFKMVPAAAVVGGGLLGGLPGAVATGLAVSPRAQLSVGRAAGALKGGGKVVYDKSLEGAARAVDFLKERTPAEIRSLLLNDNMNAQLLKTMIGTQPSIDALSQHISGQAINAVNAQTAPTPINPKGK